MNVIQIMEQKKTEFTPNDQLIYQKISKDPGKIVQMTVRRLWCLPARAHKIRKRTWLHTVSGFPCRSYRMACRAEDTADAGL